MERSRIELEMELAEQTALAKERNAMLVSMAIMALGLSACVWSERIGSDPLLIAGLLLGFFGIGGMAGCLAASLREAMRGRGSGKEERDVR